MRRGTAPLSPSCPNSKPQLRNKDVSSACFLGISSHVEIGETWWPRSSPCLVGFCFDWRWLCKPGHAIGRSNWMGRNEWEQNGRFQNQVQFFLLSQGTATCCQRPREMGTWLAGSDCPIFDSALREGSRHDEDG